MQRKSQWGLAAIKVLALVVILGGTATVGYMVYRYLTTPRHFAHFSEETVLYLRLSEFGSLKDRLKGP